MDGSGTHLPDSFEPWIEYCNSKGRNPAPIDAMPATVTLYVYGLGVWYLINNSQRGVMKFLREESHELSIRIIEKDSEGGVASDTTTPVPMTNDVIFIAGNKPERTRIELNQRMPFNRYEWQWNDPEDIRWLVNMTNDIHYGVPVVPIENDKVLTPLWVHNALFYTKNFSDYNMDVTMPNGGVINDKFGAVSCVIGAKIEAESVRIFLNDRIDRTLNKVSNFTHEIYIFNKGEDLVADFYKYYWIMAEQSPIPQKFDLEAVGMKALSNGIVCNSVWGDGDGGDGL